MKNSRFWHSFKIEQSPGGYFSNVEFIADRLSAVGFMPVVYDSNGIGTALYYGFITPEEVHQHTSFSLSHISRLNFFSLDRIDPIRESRSNILRLNVSLETDLNELKTEYKVQYIITVNDNLTGY